MIDSILIFSRAIPHHQPGGMETLAWSLAAEWAKAIPSVQIVTTSVPGAGGPFAEDGIMVAPVRRTPPGRYSRAWWSGSLESWRARQAPPAIVVSVSAGAYSVVAERHRHPRTPFVLQAHGTTAMEIGSKLRTPDLRSLLGAPRNAMGLVRDLVRYRQFDRVVAVGDNVARSLRRRPQRWSAPAEKIRLIPNGVRVADHGYDARARREIRAAHGIDDGTAVVACVGRMHIQKRLDRAIRAAAALRGGGDVSRFRFLMVGDGPDEGRLRALVRELRLESIVHFVGRVESTRVREYHAAADVALLTTARLEAGLPMTVLEALACGLPCVVPTGAVGSPALDRILVEVDPTVPGQVARTLRAAVRAPRDRVSLLPPEYLLEQCARAYLADFQDLASVAR